MNKPKLNMIVCVAENNLIGDKVPEGNGLLWHSLEELNYYKSKTVGNVVLFGENTAKYVPINLMKKNIEEQLDKKATIIDINPITYSNESTVGYEKLENDYDLEL